jgi:heat shock protein HslJ
MQRAYLLHQDSVLNQIHMKLITFISTGIFIVLAGLMMKKETTTDQSLYETKWWLRKIHSESGVENVRSNAFIQFNQEKKSAGGNGSCNSFGSTAIVNNNEVSFANIFSTKMFCEGVQKTEDAFLQQLGEVNRFEIKDKSLSLYKSDKLLLEFSSDPTK